MSRTFGIKDLETNDLIMGSYLFHLIPLCICIKINHIFYMTNSQMCLFEFIIMPWLEHE